MQAVQELILYGLKGMAAYASHARRLGESDESVGTSSRRRCSRR